MSTFSEPFILEDKSRLPEIFQLRVRAYQDSPLKSHITPEKYPDGYSDNLDNSGIHFVVCDANDRIIAAARLNAINCIEELPYPGVFRSFELPPEKPFLFYSRLVVESDFRNNRLAANLLRNVMCYHKEKSFPYGITTVKNNINMVLSVGFEKLGIIDCESDKNYVFANEVTTYAVIIKLEKIKS